MHCLVRGIRFQFFGPRVFMVFRIRQLSQVCESVLESYRLKYCERVRYSESSLHLPDEPNEFYLFALLCCVVLWSRNVLFPIVFLPFPQPNTARH